MGQSLATNAYIKGKHIAFRKIQMAMLHIYILYTSQGLKVVSCNFNLYFYYYYFFRGKVRCLASPVPYCLSVSWDGNRLDTYRGGDDEALLPDSLWPALFIKSSIYCWVVSGIHFPMYCPLSATQSQFDCGTLPYRSNNSNLLLYHGLGPIC